MFERILVALDSCSDNEQIFNTALSLAKLTQARLLLVNILSNCSINPAHAHLENAYSSQWNNSQSSLQQKQEAEVEMLRSFHALARKTGVGADLAHPLANPETDICKLAVDWGADLIVMGRRELLNVEPVGEQPVNHNQVVSQAACPVLVVQYQQTPYPTFNLDPVVPQPSLARKIADTYSSLFQD